MTIQDAGGGTGPTAPARSGSGSVTPQTYDRSWTVQTPSSTRRRAGGDISWLQLLWSSTNRQLRARYRESSGRGMWNVIQPIIMVLIYGFVFSQIFGATGTASLPYLTMAWAGIICWQYFQQGAQMGMWSFVHEASTLPKVWYPRIVVPLTPATVGGFDLLIGIGLLFVVALIQGVRPSVELVALPAALVLLAIWTYAAALLVAPMTVFIRDLATFIPLLLRLGFFASPVMYSANKYSEEGYTWLGTLNPIAVAITGVRDTLGGEWPAWNLLLYHSLMGLFLVGLGVLYLRRVENRLVDAL